jgi:Ca2+-binding EF-hand superfamily protein
LLSGVYDRQILIEALKKLDINEDGLIHVDEMRYFVDMYGETLQEWQMIKIHGIIERSVAGLY